MTYKYILVHTSTYHDTPIPSTTYHHFLLPLPLHGAAEPWAAEVEAVGHCGHVLLAVAAVQEDVPHGLEASVGGHVCMCV
ncbi:MAG: hypothetical protein ACK53Y_05280, partial [bacterium]